MLLATTPQVVVAMTVATMYKLLVAGTNVFFCKVADYMKWLHDYFTDSFKQLVGEAKSELKDLEEEKRSDRLCAAHSEALHESSH